MPWTVGNVDEHKKGLSDKQKAQWVRIANSALASCLKKGGTDATCAASAIKQANGVVGTNSGNYSVCKNRQELEYDIEIKRHQGKAHLVVPVVMIVEGVLNGSHGPLLHLAEEFGKIPAVWNGIPVVINHPEEDGVNVSANAPDVIEKCVGRVYNAHVDGKKLKAEVWLDEDQLNEISPEILNDIYSNRMVEVSVGVFTEDEEDEGEYGGIQYNAIARNHKPDHLALLMGCVGACSIADGCGVRANNERPLGHEDIEDIQPSHEDGKAGVEDVNKVSNNSKFKKEVKMPKNECPNCLKKIDALLANKESGFVEEDRGWLETLSESALDRIAPRVIEKEKIVEKTVEVNKLTPEDQAALDFGKRQMRERREGWVRGIQANTEQGVWSDEKLKKMDDDTLESIFKSVRKKEEVVDYSVNGFINVNEADEIEPLPPTGITFDEKK